MPPFYLPFRVAGVSLWLVCWFTIYRSITESQSGALGKASNESCFSGFCSQDAHACASLKRPLAASRNRFPVTSPIGDRLLQLVSIQPTECLEEHKNQRQQKKLDCNWILCANDLDIDRVSANGDHCYKRWKVGFGTNQEPNSLD
jgi:hypothetical protein